MQDFTLPKGERGARLARIVSFLTSLSPTRAWRIEITEERSTRSIQQCRYLNGVAYKRLSDATGFERDDISEFLCGTYFGWKTVKVPKTPNNPAGIEDRPLRTTTTDENGKRSVLTTTEFMDYVAFVQRFAAGKGVYIPDPEEQFEEEHADAA